MSTNRMLGTSVTDGALVLTSDEGTAQLPLLAGALHFHDVPRANWGRCLDGLVDLGFELVDSCVPWSIYEPNRDQFLFQDAGRPDLGAFLRACASRDLKVILQLGPLLDLELASLGLPQWICRDQQYLALGAHGNPLILPAVASATALPSLSSNAFLQRAERWTAALAAYLKPFCYPAGPLVAVHVGARAGLAGRLGAYDHDYHPDAVTAYRAWLEQRYPDDLPAGYRGAARTADPPRRFDARRVEDLVVHLDWLAFKEQAVCSTLGRLARAAKTGGLDQLALLHGLDNGDLGLSCSPQQAEQTVDAVGIELAPARANRDLAQHTATWLHGNSRLPFVWRLAWGNRPWLWVPQSTSQQLDSALTALMYGIRGASFSTVVERNHWFDGAIDSAADAQRDRYDQLRLLVRALGDLRWHALNRSVTVGLMRVREVEQLVRCSSLADPLPPQLFALLGLNGGDLLPDKPLAFGGLDLDAVRRWSETMQRELCAQDVPYAIVDSTQTVEQLCRYRLLLVPLFELTDPALLQRLRDYAGAGGKLAICPHVPRLGLTGQELTASQAELPPHTVLETPAQLRPVLQQLAAEDDIVGSKGPLASSLHVPADRSTRDSVLFVRNPTNVARSARLTDEARFWDALTGVPLAQQALQLEPRELRMLRCRFRKPEKES